VLSPARDRLNPGTPGEFSSPDHQAADDVSEAFNPYREWLGLRADIDAPDYYQLLGLEPFESDRTRLTTAADRALARVRGFRPGVHAAAWARLLDELASAKSCFSDPERKSTYDNRLRQSGARSQPVETPSRPQLQVAPSSASPDLYPPGMAPAVADSVPISSTHVQRPATVPHPANLSPEDPMAHHVPGAATRPAATAQTPSRPSGSPTVSAFPPRNPYPPGVSPVLEGIPAAPSARTRPPAVSPPAGAQTASPVPVAEVAAESEQNVVREPVPPGPVNAHVAPPREEKTSLLPLTAIVASVVVVLTAIVLVIALRDDAGGSALVPRDPLPTSPVTSSSPAETAQPLVPTGPAPTGRPPAAGAKTPGQSGPAGQGPVNQNRSTSSGTATGAAPDPPAMNVVQAPITPAEPATVPPVPEPESAPPVPDSPPAPAPTPPNVDAPTASTDSPPAAAELRRLGELLQQARSAIAVHQFRVAGEALQKAAAVAKTAEHEALVGRWQRLNQCAGEFWDIVTAAALKLQPVEEISIGSGELIVVVVETGRDSITIRNQGRNITYPLADLPAGLALAIARRNLNEDDPQNQVLFGAGLVTANDTKPLHIDEARRYWQRAASAGVAVEDLLATLTDSYKLAH
jgi:hypothetical protein